MTSRATRVYQQTEEMGQLSLMPVFQAVDKKLILIDKLQSLKTSTQTQNLSQTLLPDSTSKDRDLKPFWDECVKAMSDLLWLPTKTDSLVLGLTSSNGSYSKTTQDSWFSTKTTFPQSEKWLRNTIFSKPKIF